MLTEIKEINEKNQNFYGVLIMLTNHTPFDDLDMYGENTATDLSEGEYKVTKADLTSDISEGHDYRFVGKIGNFCPVKPGVGGGLLVREKNGKYYSAGGAKGYRWMEVRRKG